MRKSESSPKIKLKASQTALVFLEFGMLLQYQNKDAAYRRIKWNFSNIQLSCMLVLHEVSTYSPATYKTADL